MDFFFLDRPISATEIKSFLCRVVVSKTSPLTQFAPFSLPGTPSHNTDDILPAILPEPSVGTSTTTFRKAARERGASVKLAQLAGFHASRSKEQSKALKSDRVKSYELPNPERYFEELMKNEDYSRDVRVLLEKIRPRHAYLVTGFLTTTNSAWKIDGSHSNETGVNVTVPVSAVLPAAVAGAVDINGCLSGSSTSEQSDERAVAEEEIFAVSYSVARLSYKPSASRTLFTSIPTIGQPKRAKAHHLTFSRDEEEEEEEKLDWDSDDAIEQFKSGSVKISQSIDDAEVIISGIETDESPLNTSH